MVRELRSVYLPAVDLKLHALIYGFFTIPNTKINNFNETFLDRGCYFQVGNSLKLGISIPTAYRIALRTWASWVEENIDPDKTRVFIRTFEPSHWRYII